MKLHFYRLFEASKNDIPPAGGGGGTPPVVTPPLSTDLRTYISDDKGALKDGWHTAFGVPETLGKKFTNIAALAKSYESLERLNGNPNKVTLPGENSTEEERRAFFTALGVPDKPEGYAIERPKDLDERLWDEERNKGFLALAHKHGITPAAAKALVEFEAANTKAALEKAETDAKAATAGLVAALKKEWGAAYDEKRQAAAVIFEKLGGAELFGQDTVIDNHPAFTKLLAKVADMVGEKGTAAGLKDQRRGSVEDASAELNRIMGDKADPYFKAGHPSHDDRVAYVMDLRRQITPK
jgi:hypothetical protein